MQDLVYERLLSEVDRLEPADGPPIRINGDWYRSDVFHVGDVDADDKESFVEEYVQVAKDFLEAEFPDAGSIYLFNNHIESMGGGPFSSDKFKSTVTLRVVVPDSTSLAHLREIGDVDDLVAEIEDHKSQFPDKKFLGYVGKGKDHVLEIREGSLEEDGSSYSVFFMDVEGERTPIDLMNQIENDENPEFDISLRSRTFVKDGDTIFEIVEDKEEEFKMMA